MEGNWIKIPVIIGRNRLRGSATGAMVDDDLGEDNLATLRNFLRGEALAKKVEATQEWLTVSINALLRLFDESHAAWVANKTDTIGHVFEAGFPSGKSLLMGDRRILARLPFKE